MDTGNAKPNGAYAAMQVPQVLMPDHSSDVDEPFMCLICLELVHKPVVNACGHMFCFLCIHHAMNTKAESYCPLCRKPYLYFPRICEQLHFLLLRILPHSYRRRCEEAWAVELSTEIFSPQFDDGLRFDKDGFETVSTSMMENDKLDDFDVVLPPELLIEAQFTRSYYQQTMEGEHLQTSLYPVRQTESIPSLGPSTRVECNGRDWEANRGVSSVSSSTAGSSVSCFSCKKLLCRPVVLNCGHVFCEGCVANTDNGGYCHLKCSTCGSLHPGSFPSVFLELHHYLETTFTSEYAKRKSELNWQAADRKRSIDTVNRNYHPIRQEIDIRQIHPCVGCDGCGMFPMTGRRFKCIDCPVKIGYDLCSNCRESEMIPVGRFNQNHTRQHRMTEVTLRDGGYRLLDTEGSLENNEDTISSMEGMEEELSETRPLEFQLAIEASSF